MKERAIRSPLSTESGVVSELILQSDCGLLPALFGDTVASLLGRLQAAPSNPYSSENILVIAGGPGSPGVRGALVGSIAGRTLAERMRTAVLLLGWYGPAALARFPRLARAGKALDDLRPDDFYLSHIAVLPEHRGRGEGGELLRAGEERAARVGGRRMVLDVEQDAEGARAFYARSGYRFDSRLRIDLGRRGGYSFFRLTKDLRRP
jgi:ribosomal protein S18 acetylase RimI-like enzyme